MTMIPRWKQAQYYFQAMEEDERKEMVTPIEVMTLEEAGKAIRFIIAILGKPYTANTSDVQGHPYFHRKVVWKVKPDPTLADTHANVKDILRRRIVEAGITKFKITGMGWLHIRLPVDVYVGSFNSSDDPKVWKEKNDKTRRRYMIMEVGRRLDGKRSK